MLSKFIHIVACIQIPFPLLAKYIPLYRHSAYSSSVHQLMDIWIVSAFCLLGVTLLWTFTRQHLCARMFSFLLGVHLGVEPHSHMATLYLTFSGSAWLFSTAAALLLPRHQQGTGSSYSTSSPAWVFPSFWWKPSCGCALACLCFCMACKLRIVFLFLKGYNTHREEENVTEMVCDPQSLN